MSLIVDKTPLSQSILDTTFTTTSGQSSFAQLQGQWIVLYFYPRDNTPGCTFEGNDFSFLHPSFKKLNAMILGISKDSLESHEKFKLKYQFPFDLISDSESILCDYFDVMRPKKLYGKITFGIQRSTFLIDPKQIIQTVWRNVRTKDHAQTVLKQLQQYGQKR
ncbi:MAG: peroxiredoxin [Endozoicomonadaceae bacterium]|nr:peroxiredoxin [Endozoicomonadaceae bacterium]